MIIGLLLGGWIVQIDGTERTEKKNTTTNHKGGRLPPLTPLPSMPLPMLLQMTIIDLLLGRRIVQIAAHNTKTVYST